VDRRVFSGLILDYWIFRLVGTDLLLLRFSASMETGLLSVLRGAVWMRSLLLVGVRHRRALLHSSRGRSASSVCKVSRPDNWLITIIRLRSSVKCTLSIE
jgi:hypothetical protein